MDHRHDGDFSFLEGRNDIPELVKTASDAEPTLFAYNDGMRSFFPIDTPANVWLSAAFFEKNAGEIPKEACPVIEQAIGDALAFHGVEYQSMVKTAEVDDSLIKLASQIIDFEQHYKTAGFRERQKNAKTIMKNVAGMRHHFEGTNHEIPESLARYGGDHLAHDWRENVLPRLRMVGSKEGRADYDAILNSKDSAETAPDTLVDLLEFVDRKHGLHGHYDTRLHDPVRSIMSCVPPKKTVVVVLSVGDKHFTESDVERLDKNALGQHFSEDAVDAIFNSKQNMHGLPDVVKKVLAEILSR